VAERSKAHAWKVC